MFAYFGHHKSASTWILNILQSICNHSDMRILRFRELEGVDISTLDFIADVNAEVTHLPQIGEFRGFHVIRDPRDIVVSAYFSHKLSHPLDAWLVERRKLLNSIGLKEGLQLTIDFLEGVFQRLSTWNYSLPYVYETRFETITTEPIDEFTLVFKFLKLYPDPVSQEKLEDIVGWHSFEKMSEGRGKGDEDASHHYRKGIIGDWRNFLDEDNKNYFKEHYGLLLIDLGYEKDMNW